MIFVDYYENHHEIWQEKCNLFLKEVLSVSYQAITEKCLCTLKCVRTLWGIVF